MLSRQQSPSSLEQTSSPLYSSTLSLGRLHCSRYRSLRPTTTDARQALRFTEATRARIEKAMDDCLTFDQQLSELPLARTRYTHHLHLIKVIEVEGCGCCIDQSH
nr:large subunit ribosomal protein L18e [Ipomoea batatas]